MRAFAVVLAAGSGTRFGGDKTRTILVGKPVWRWSFETLLRHPRIEGVGLVVPAAMVEQYRAEAPEAAFVVAGGSDRTESSRIGFSSCPEGVDVVLVHDAARPLVSEAVIDRVIDAAWRSGAAAPGLPITDTVKRVTPTEFETLDRSQLWTVQTPQGFRAEALRLAHRQADSGTTDDLALAEAAGTRPEIVPGNVQNLKITMPEDLFLAEVYAQGTAGPRVGLGYDVHAFSDDPGRELFLGGVRFPESVGLEGHSDADVLIHAVVDALLGAAALGDIGQHFPNNDPRWKNVSSETFLRHARTLLGERRWTIVNVDVALIAEKPKIMVRSDEIRQKLADIMEVDLSQIGLKATTNERLGAIGRGEGIAAFAVATIAPCLGG